MGFDGKKLEPQILDGSFDLLCDDLSALRKRIEAARSDLEAVSKFCVLSDTSFQSEEDVLSFREICGTRINIREASIFSRSLLRDAGGHEGGTGAILGMSG